MVSRQSCAHFQTPTSYQDEMEKHPSVFSSLSDIGKMPIQLSGRSKVLTAVYHPGIEQNHKSRGAGQHTIIL